MEMTSQRESRMSTRKKATTPEVKPVASSDFDHIEVPLGALRMELAQLQKDGIDSMPLGYFLQMLHAVIKRERADSSL
jgi:hypothetical protein